MKVKIIFAESIHFGLAAASRVVAYAKGLEENNCEVEVLMPYSFVREDFEDFSQSGIYNGIHYSYLQFSSENPFSKYPKGISHLIAIINKYLGYFKFFTYSIFSKREFDVVFVYKFSTFFTLFLFLLNRKKLRVSELCEIPYHDQKGFKQKTNRKIRELILFPLFDVVVVISKNLCDYASGLVRKNSLIIRVPILYQKPIHVLKKHQPVVPYFVHSGSLSESKDGVVSFLKAFGMAIQRTDIPFHFYFTGNLNTTPDRLKIENIIQEYHLEDRVHFIGYLSRRELLLLQQGAEVAIINKINNEMNYYNFPTKVAEYMLNEIAIISSKIGELSLVLTDNENVIFYEPGNMNDLTDAIVRLINQKELRHIIASNGRKFAEQNFNYFSHGKRLAECFNIALLNKTKGQRN